MLMWITAAVYLLGAAAFVSVWTKGRQPNVIPLAAAVICGACAAFIPGLTEAWRFFIALIFGWTGWLIAAFIVSRELIVQSATMLLAFVTSWLPFARMDPVEWEYVLIAVAVLSCFLFGVASHVKNGELSPVSEQYSAKKYESFLVLLPLISVLLAPLVTFSQSKPSVFAAAVTTGMLFITSALLFILQDQIRQRVKAQTLNRAYEEWQKESRDYMNTIRSQRHDFNLHLHAISGLVSNGEYEECGEYVRKLAAEAAAVNDIMPVADAVVGSMLYKMREKARGKGSDIYYSITYDMADTVCNGFECNKIIGNLLQNAIDALESDEDKEFGIRTSIFKRRGFTVVTVENRFSGDVDSIAKAFEPGYSTKKKHEGIGLSMVKRTVTHYGGRIYPEFEDGRIRFVVNIPNRIGAQETEA